MRRAAALMLLALVAVPAGPAFAKGPTEVVVDGPGVHVTLQHDDESAPVPMWRLGGSARVWELYGVRPLGEAPKLTAEQLGPRFVLTWSLLSDPVGVQYAYPFAEGGPWIEVPAGQRLYGSKVPSGWVSAKPSLTRRLVLLGAARPSAEAARTSQVSRSKPAVVVEDDRTPWMAVGAAGGALVLALAALAVRRRAG